MKISAQTCLYSHVWGLQKTMLFLQALIVFPEADMNLCIIDNNDSFTYNIVDLVRKIKGMEPEVITSYESGPEQVRKLDHADSIILSPGPGLPYEHPLMQEAIRKYAGSKPLLGICLGHQAISTYYGAEMKNLDRVVHGQPKKMKVCGDSILFRGLPRSFTVGLYHSWVVKSGSLPKELKLTGKSEEGLIMAMENRDKLLFGLQFHPESFISEYGAEILSNFIEL